MKKQLLALALAGVALPLSAPAAAQQLPPAVIVLVDLAEMIDTSAAAKTAATELKPKADQLQARLSTLQTSLSAEEKTLRDTAPPQGATPAAQQAWETKVRDFQNRQQQAQQEIQRRQQEIETSRQWIIKQINDAAQPIIGQIMRERGATIAMDERVTIQHTPAVDITADVIARLDKALPKVSITPPAPPAAAPATSAPAPAAPPRR